MNMQSMEIWQALRDYWTSLEVARWVESRFFLRRHHQLKSYGQASAGYPIALNTNGEIDTSFMPDALLRDGSRTLTADWDIGDNQRVLADGVRARDGAGLRLEDDAGNLGVFVEDGGQVGIGTTSPSDTLQLEAATQPFFSANFTNSASFGGLRFRENGTITGAYLAIGSTFSTVNRRNYMEFQSLINGGGINFWTNDGTIAERMRILDNGNVGIGTTTPGGKLEVDQASATANIPTLHLRQADNSEEFIRFEATVGAGNAIDTAALGTYYGKIRVHVDGVGDKFIALYNT